MNAEAAPDAPAAPLQIDTKGALRLDQLMLIGTVTLVLAVIALSGGVQVYSTSKDFDQSTETQRKQLEDQGHDTSRLTARLVAGTIANALRDSDYTTLDNAAFPVVRDNKNILRVVIADARGVVATDTSDKKVAEKAVTLPKGQDDAFIETTFQNHPVFEYRAPALSSDGKRMGTVIVDYSKEPLLQELQRLEEARRASVQKIIVRTAGLGLGFLLVAIVLAAFQGRRVTQPLGKLTDEAMRLAGGDLSARVEKTTTAGREVMALGSVFNHMADRIQVLLNETRVKAETDQQLAIARTVQESILPSRDAATFGSVAIAGLVESADQCGGDWWLRIPLDERRVVVCIGDVTGHGIAPALVTAAACSCIVSGIEVSAGKINTASLMAHLNKTIYGMARGQHQMSCCIATVDLVSGEIEMTNAAHPFPYTFQSQNKKAIAVGARGALIGESDTATFSPVRAQLNPGDAILWYTDGITEAENPDLLQFGTKRLRQALERFGNLPPDALRDAIFDEVIEHCQGYPPSDDRTIIVTKFGA